MNQITIFRTTTTPAPKSTTDKELLNIQFDLTGTEEYSYIDDVIEYSNNVDDNDIDYSNYAESVDYSKWSTSTVPEKSTDVDYSKTTVELSSSTTPMPSTTASTTSETEFVTFSIVGQTSADEISTKFETLLGDSSAIPVTSSTTVPPLSTVSTTLEQIQGMFCFIMN